MRKAVALFFVTFYGVSAARFMGVIVALVTVFLGDKPKKK